MNYWTRRAAFQRRSLVRFVCLCLHSPHSWRGPELKDLAGEEDEIKAGRLKSSQGSYPNYQQGGYQQGGFQQGGYQQGGYPQGGNQQGYGRPASGSSGNSFTDQITSSLKSIGTNLLKNALNDALSGKN